MRSIAGLAVLIAIILAACGGGDEDRTAGIIHRLLLAAGTDEAGALQSYVGSLPEGLPAEPPLYPGADLVVSSEQPAPFGDFDRDLGDGNVASPVLYFIVLDTDDQREKVRAFYEQGLNQDPWQLESSFATIELDTLQFFSVDDPDIAGAVSIASGGSDARTSILISLQDAGAFREEAPDFELSDSLAVPGDFPPDVPVYAGATITGTAFFREPGSESFLLIFLTTDSQDDVIAFYRDAFQERGWSVTDGETFGLEELIDFRDDGLDIQGEVLADRFPEARSYTEVRLQVQLSPSREPVSLDDAPTATPDE